MEKGISHRGRRFKGPGKELNGINLSLAKFFSMTGMQNVRKDGGMRCWKNNQGTQRWYRKWSIDVIGFGV